MTTQSWETIVADIEKNLGSEVEKEIAKAAQAERERIKRIIKEMSIDQTEDGKQIEKMADKFGVPVSVMANRLLEKAKIKALKEIEL